MSERRMQLLLVGGVEGDVDALERILRAGDGDVDAVVLVGDLCAAWSRPDTYRAVFKALGRAGLPAFWIPGETDAPINEYLSEAWNIETAYPRLHGVHGTAASASSQVVVAGMGGRIGDDPDTIRVEEALLRYAAWEVEYRLKVLQEFDQSWIVLLFTTAPAHKGRGEPGSEVLAELIKTYKARLAVVAGEQSTEFLGKTQVVRPGFARHGEYAIAELHHQSVAFATVPHASPASSQS
jgi:uncharacterized protein